MARLALVISLVALVIAILAYQEAGGRRTLEDHVRAVQNAAEAARRETADALARMERALRSTESTQGAPAKPKP